MASKGTLISFLLLSNFALFVVSAPQSQEAPGNVSGSDSTDNIPPAAPSGTASAPDTSIFPVTEDPAATGATETSDPEAHVTFSALAPATGAAPASAPASEPASTPASEPGSAPASPPASDPASGPASDGASGPASDRAFGPASDGASGPASDRAFGPASDGASGPASDGASGPASDRPFGPASDPPFGPASAPASAPAVVPAQAVEESNVVPVIKVPPNSLTDSVVANNKDQITKTVQNQTPGVNVQVNNNDQQVVQPQEAKPVNQPTQIVVDPPKYCASACGKASNTGCFGALIKACETSGANNTVRGRSNVVCSSRSDDAMISSRGSAKRNSVHAQFVNMVKGCGAMINDCGRGTEVNDVTSDNINLVGGLVGQNCEDSFRNVLNCAVKCAERRG